ncbi:hypothetical protein [Helicobacter cinaedi]|uniref:hypothetical protein n=1 Tax=Helicobacter cinaedi TaxID=213 RepID=UPI000D7C0898|nr:hypothetical protein [Helicobacter cinaedi]
MKDKIIDFYAIATNGKYGNKIDVERAIELTEEFNLIFSLEEQILEYENTIRRKTGMELKIINPVAVVVGNAIKIAEIEFQNLGLDIGIGQYQDFRNFAILLEDYEKKQLIETYKHNTEVLENLSITTKKVLDYAFYGLDRIKEDAEKESTQTLKRKFR